MHDDRTLLEGRLSRFTTDHLAPAVHRDRAPLTLTAWAVPGEPVPFAEAVDPEISDFVPFEVGSAYGPPWATTWFRATGTVPEGWDSREGTAVEAAVQWRSWTGHGRYADLSHATYGAR